VQQQEIDYVEDFNGNITTYEIKWNVYAKAKTHKIFNETYNAQTEIINSEKSLF
jgi:hypothetical protein